MTKKEALKAAIAVLRTLEPEEEYREIILGLEKYEPASYRRKWTRSAIYEAVAVWIAANGRYPSTKEMECERSLPCAFVIRREYHMSSREFLNKYYKPEMDTHRKSDKAGQRLDIFVKEYERILPSSARDYNKRRKEGLPTWNQTANALGICRWTDLLILAGVDVSCLRQVSKRLRNVNKKADANDSTYNVKRRG